MTIFLFIDVNTNYLYSCNMRYLLYDKHVNNTWVLENVFIVIGNMKVCMIIPHVHLIALKRLENNWNMSH
jgi:hypothetical protein